MMNALIIDDERNAIQAICGLLELYCPSVKVIGQANTVAEGLQLIEHLAPKLVFLDIHIGKQTGFNLLEGLDKIHFHLIFTTAYSEYAVHAFRHNAVDYLLKPIDPLLLIEAIEKAKTRDLFADDLDRVKQLLQVLKKPVRDHLTIATAEGYHIVDIAQLVRIEGEGNYSTFHLANGEKIVASKNLKYFSEQLSTYEFVQTHQSHLISIPTIRQWLHEDGGFILLLDGTQIPVARRRKEAVKAALRIC